MCIRDRDSTPEPVKDVMREKESIISIPRKKEKKLSVKPIIKNKESEDKPESEKELPKVSEVTKSLVSNLLKNKTNQHNNNS